MAEIIGKSPISFPIFILGKLAFLISFLFCFLKWFNIATMFYDSLITQIIGIVLFIAGLIIVIIGVVQLGQSRAFGLPETETILKSNGLYRFSRNPMYFGGFIMCAGSCFFSIHLFNFLCFAIAFGTHFQIIIKEEEFLANRFGQEWIEYKQRVPRFFIFF
jgi:protein-S-isoprenylcysteine O-methyltransferase Ste14